MIDTRIITDSACDIPDEYLAVCPEIVMLNIPMVVDGEPKRERRDYSIAEFYDVLAQSREIPTTSQITMVEYYEAFQQALQDGVCHLVCITITAKGSNMYNAALMARDFLWENEPGSKEKMTVDVIDSREYTMIYGVPVLQSVKMLREGQDYTRVVDFLSHIPENYDSSFAVFQLKYAKKSGRISAAAAFAGEMMGLRPMMTIRDGNVAIVGKVRGDKAAVQKMVANYEAAADGNANHPYVIMWGNNETHLKELQEILAAKKHTNCWGVHQIGACITINSGPDLLGIFYPRKK